MAKKTVNPSQNWAAIAYPAEITSELDDSVIREAFVDAARAAHKFGRTWAVALSPLHSPELTEEQRQVAIDAVVSDYEKKISKAKSDGARKSLELKMEEALEEVRNKELKPHYHFQMRFRKIIRSSAANSHLELFDGLLKIGGESLFSFTSVVRIGSAGKYFEYLTHSNDYDKEQFNGDLPTVFPPSYKFSSKQETEEERDMKLSEVESLAFSGKFDGYASLYEYVSKEAQKNGALDWAMIRSIMRRNMHHLDKLANSSFLKKNNRV